MGILASPRREKFAREYAKCGVGSYAYNKAYGIHIKPTCARAAAWRLLRRSPEITKRIQEVRMEIKRKSDITFEKILNDYQWALENAKGTMDAEGNIVGIRPETVVSAATAQAKLVGLIVDRKEIRGAGEFESMDNISDILQAVADQAGPDAALALSKVFNLTGHDVEAGVILQDATNEQAEALYNAKPASDQVN